MVLGQVDAVGEHQSVREGDIQTASSEEQIVLRWVVANEDIRESHTIEIVLSSEGPYHRCGSFDQRVYFSYNVRPPRSGSSSTS